MYSISTNCNYPHTVACYSECMTWGQYILPGAAITGIVGTLAWLMRGVSMPIFETAGPVAEGERSVIILTLFLCSLVVVPVFALLFYFAWKYRDGAPATKRKHAPDWDHENPWLEFTWWLVPTAIVFCLGILAWQSTRVLDPYKPLASSQVPLQVQVVALDWKWLFIYPELGVASVNQLYVPVGRPVSFAITADAPMNSFWIPSLGGQIMAMPGMITYLNLKADHVGTYQGSSANISGAGFAGMTFTVEAVQESDFALWVHSVQQGTSPLGTQVYTRLAVPSSYDTARYYAPVEPGLFDSVVHSYMQHLQQGSTMSSMSEEEMRAMPEMKLPTPQ